MAESKDSRNHGVPAPLIVALAVVLFVTTSATIIAVIWASKHARVKSPPAAGPTNSAASVDSRRDVPVRTSSAISSPAPSLNQMAMKGEYGDAERQLRELAARAKKLSTNDTQKLEVHLVDLARLLYRQGRYAEAEPLYREVIQMREVRLRPDSETILETKAGLARLLSDWAWIEHTNSRGTIPSPGSATPLERAVDAEKLMHDCLNARLNGRTPLSWRTADTKSRLGWAMVVVAATDSSLSSESRRAKLEEAEAHLLDGNDSLQKDMSVNRIYKRDALERLVRLYEIAGKKDQAVAWKQKYGTLVGSQSLP